MVAEASSAKPSSRTWLRDGVRGWGAGCKSHVETRGAAWSRARRTLRFHAINSITTVRVIATESWLRWTAAGAAVNRKLFFSFYKT